MNYNSLANYYTVLFALAQHHKYSLSDLDELIPFERDIYAEMLMKHISEQKEKLEQRG